MLPSLEYGLALEKKMCEEYGIPVFLHSPQDRMRSILAYRNDRRLFRRTCDMSGASIISAYHKDAPFPVIKSSLWWGDAWDAMACGFVPDLSQSFFEQFAMLQLKVPREGTSVVNSENCEYNSHTRDSKNGYLNHLSAKSENLLYSHLMISCVDCLDGISNTDCTLCFDCGYVNHCYECVKCEECSNCTDCHFSYQLRGCSHCFQCSNLVNKKYYFRNQPCTPEEFVRLKNSVLDGNSLTYRTACEEYASLKRSTPQRASHLLNGEHVFGEHVTDSRHCYHCFDIRSSEDCFNLWNGGSNDVVHGYSVLMPPSQAVFSCVTIRGCHNIFFSANCWNSHDLWYCDNCANCSDCFGCVGLKKKRHCFFNVQYSMDEYQAVLGAWRDHMIDIKEWGEFFPMRFSPFCYNESAAQDFFPRTRDQIESEGLRYRKFDDVVTRSDVASRAGEKPPSRVTDLKADMILSCPTCLLMFRIVAQEIDFYHRMHVPPPQQCPECRLNARIADRCPYSLILRQCSSCAVDVETVYTAERSPHILCETCYAHTTI